MANKPLGDPVHYEIKKDHFATLKNVFEQVKHNINGAHGWNRPIEQVDGLTMDFLGQNKIRISHKKYVVASPYVMNMREKTGAVEFLNAITAEVKKRYAKMAGTPVTLNQIQEDQDIQLYSKLSPDQSWALGSVQGTMIGRYMVTTSRVFEVRSKILRVDADDE